MAKAKSAPRATSATKPAAAPAAQAPAPAPAPVAAPAPAPVAVALRGGIAVAAVVPTGKLYRTAAAHNRQWWHSVQQACAAGPAQVAALCTPAPAGPGVPAHFVGYCMRRGYLKAA